MAEKRVQKAGEPALYRDHSASMDMPSADA